MLLRALYSENIFAVLVMFENANVGAISTSLKRFCIRQEAHLVKPSAEFACRNSRIRMK